MALKTPAPNARAPQRRIEESDAAPRGMTAAGTYVITGLLLVMGVAAVAFGWSQVEIVTAGGREEALTPAWMWLAFLLTLIVSIVGARADHSTLYSSHARFWFHREGSDGAHGLMLSLIRVNVSLLQPVALLRAEKGER